MIIGYDFDGVGYVFGGAVRNHLMSQGIVVPPATDEFCTNWDFYQFWGMTREEFEDHCDAGVDAGIIFGPGEGLTRPNFFESIRMAKSLGHKVVGITHRYQGSPFVAQRNTYRWLEPVLDLFDDVVFSKDKTIVKTDMFVEDNRDNYDRLIEAGVDAYLINRPWNGPYDDHRNRITDVSDYTAAVVGRSVGRVLV